MLMWVKAGSGGRNAAPERGFDSNGHHAGNSLEGERMKQAYWHRFPVWIRVSAGVLLGTLFAVLLV